MVLLRHSARESEIVSSSDEVVRPICNPSGERLERFTLRFLLTSSGAKGILFPLVRADRTRASGGIFCTGLGGHERNHSSRLASLAVFARPQSRRVGHAGDACLSRLDLRLVSANRHRRQRRLLLRDFCAACLSGRSPPSKKQLASPRRPKRPIQRLSTQRECDRKTIDSVAEPGADSRSKRFRRDPHDGF
jgi:hypothetical protein